MVLAVAAEEAEEEEAAAALPAEEKAGTAEEKTGRTPAVTPRGRGLKRLTRGGWS